MRRLTSIVAAVAATFALGSAQAAAILIDDFSTPVTQQAVIDPTVAGTTTGPATATCGTCAATTRTIMADMNVGPGLNTGLAQSVTVGFGAFPASALTFSTASQVDQVATVTWSLAPRVLAGPVSLFFRVLDSNIGLLAGGGTEQNTLAFALNGVALGTASLGNVVNADIFLTLTAAQVASLASGGTLTMLANGAPGWDLSMTSFSLQVPEPASLALVGLGLIGAGLASRRRKAV
jgi:hypothetical protein